MNLSTNGRQTTHWRFMHCGSGLTIKCSMGIQGMKCWKSTIMMESEVSIEGWGHTCYWAWLSMETLKSIKMAKVGMILQKLKDIY